jgi:hypothetical protein
LAHELKIKNPELYSRLQSNDELHFVPVTHDERERFATQQVEIPIAVNQKLYSIGEMHQILRDTATEAGIKDCASLRTTYVSVIAANLRSSMRWVGHSQKNMAADTVSRTHYVHSPNLTRAIIVEFVKRHAAVGESTRHRWLSVLAKRNILKKE